MIPNSPPDSLQAVPVAGDRIDLAWPAVEAACLYRVHRNDGVSSRLVAETASLRHVDRELKPASGYRYTVKAVDSSGRCIKTWEAACYTPDAGLSLTSEGSLLTVHGDAFEVQWDGDAGGEIVSIRQYDGDSWFRVNSDSSPTVPAFILTDAAGKDCPVHRQRGVKFAVEKQTQDEVCFSCSTTVAGVCIETRYTVFSEGVLFCELSMPKSELSAGRTQGVDSEANRALLDTISGRMSLRLDRGLLGHKFAWGHYSRQSTVASVWHDVSEHVTDDAQMMPLAMVDYGRKADGGFTNHIEFFIEDTPRAGASTWFGADGEGGFKFEWSFAGKALRDTYFLPWDMGFFRTRWGLCLGASRKGRAGRALPGRRNNLTGARVFHAPLPYGVDQEARKHWPFNVPPMNLVRTAYSGLPSDENIEEARKQGVNVIILHAGWMRCAGSNADPPADYAPRDPADMERFVASCHSRNIRIGLYMRGVEKYALYQPYFEKYLKRDYDGLYVDWNSPYVLGHQGCMDLHFSAYSHFLFIRALRQRVGEHGFLIAHSGALPTMLAFATFDAYLPGEFHIQKNRLLNTPDEALYHGFASCMGTNPIPRFDLPQAIAFYAGLGFCPHFWWRADYTEKTPLRGLWRILSSVPVEQAVVYNPRTENLRVIHCSNRHFLVTLYKVSSELLLLIAANIGPPDSAVIALDMPALGLCGSYGVDELTADAADGLHSRQVEMSPAGAIQANAFGQYEYRGYRIHLDSAPGANPVRSESLA
ncbi:MAG: fibronectin type III domain-containing protein [Planctomycetes bacterium]|nr:fibronectin type III domain-containing protein [Planctomycetota bacterium]